MQSRHIRLILFQYLLQHIRLILFQYLLRMQSRHIRLILFQYLLRMQSRHIRLILFQYYSFGSTKMSRMCLALTCFCFNICSACSQGTYGSFCFNIGSARHIRPFHARPHAAHSVSISAPHAVHTLQSVSWRLRQACCAGECTTCAEIAGPACSGRMCLDWHAKHVSRQTTYLFELEMFIYKLKVYFVFMSACRLCELSLNSHAVLVGHLLSNVT